MKNSNDWPAAAVAISLIVVIGFIVGFSINKYDTAKEALEIYAGIGTLAGLIGGAVMTYFFKQREVDSARAAADEAVSKTVEAQKQLAQTDATVKQAEVKVKQIEEKVKEAQEDADKAKLRVEDLEKDTEQLETALLDVSDQTESKLWNGLKGKGIELSLASSTRRLIERARRRRRRVGVRPDE